MDHLCHADSQPVVRRTPLTLLELEAQFRSDVVPQVGLDALRWSLGILEPSFVMPGTGSHQLW
jgi:hypothetical protein